MEELGAAPICGSWPGAGIGSVSGLNCISKLTGALELGGVAVVAGISGGSVFAPAVGEAEVASVLLAPVL